MLKVNEFLKGVYERDFKVLARVLTLVENELEGSMEILTSLTANPNASVIGVTGPPGAGKSTLVNALIEKLTAVGKQVAILAVDPTSPFNLGSLLGDRIRMSAHFNKTNVFIRSVATRGSLGGLSAKIIEMTDVLRAAGFDYIIVETVGVGQSEIEVAGLADRTIIVLVPEAGDEIQHIKSGLMEIGDAFVVNKADRGGASAFAGSLTKMLHQREKPVPVFKTVADRNEGIDGLLEWIENSGFTGNDFKSRLYAEKAFRLIQNYRMKDVRKTELQEMISQNIGSGDFNLYKFVKGFEKT